ncbi:C4-dicarboxylate ABC transporter substrate-binding protein [Chloroflexus islandicus]|uniref:C4-dicarboxylate ABC transporter substrate-binding protein n=1 Tax=Chloroflexus islandicus TaxID=1707952 RepID=A0A178MFB8_9CHLR|nr:TAXI family TRAP transporter solute-binding subunit [Chloroflexus islandicus]OAN47236.1 C4-dicarboxylate ABC transporter substrate-binding protein [Chloroflexus islandicus]
MVKRMVLLWLALALALTACGQNTGTTSQPTAAPAQPTPAPSGGKLRLIIGTGGTGGVFFPYGGGLARILTEKMPNTEATAQETGGSVDNLKLLQNDEAQIGFTTADSAYDAINGVAAYKDTGKVPAAAIAVLYQSFIHVVARADSGITSVADMKGRPVSIGSAGSSTETAAIRLLEAAGLTVADITPENLGVADSVAAMKDQKIDAFFWIGGLPTAAVTDLVTTEKVVFIDTSALLKPMVDKYGPIYAATVLPAGTYKGTDQDVPGIGVANLLVVREDMPADQVKGILTTIFDNLAEVHQIHPAARTLSLESAVTGSSIPFHPAAIEFYKERGVWKE